MIASVIEIPSRATVTEILDDLVLVVTCSLAGDCATPPVELQASIRWRIEASLTAERGHRGDEPVSGASGVAEWMQGRGLKR